MNKNIKKYAYIFMAMNLVGIAVALFIENGLGSDSIGLLCDGVQHVTGWTFGNSSLFYNLVVIILSLLFARGNIGLGTIAYALFSGYFIDFYSWLLEPLQLGNNAIGYRVIGFAIGQISLSLALAALIQMKLGMNALDALLYKINKKSSVPYSVLRTITDISYVLLGTLMGGTFGVGTILSVLLTGTMISKIIKFIELYQNKKSCITKNIL